MNMTLVRVDIVQILNIVQEAKRLTVRVFIIIICPLETYKYLHVVAHYFIL